MATASISVPSRSTSWRLVLGALAALIVAAIVFAFAVGFGSKSAAKPAPASPTPTAVTHVAGDDVAHNPTADVPLDCHAGKAC